MGKFYNYNSYNGQRRRFQRKDIRKKLNSGQERKQKISV